MMIKGIPFGIQETSCPYIDGETFYSETLYVPEIDEEGLDALLSIGYRHFGADYFRPVCDHCGKCIPLRVPAAGFPFTRNRRRVLRRGDSLSVELRDPEEDHEKYELYLKHGERFEEGGDDDYEGFVETFFRHMPFGKVLEIRRKGRLIAASHIDMTSTSLSAIYSYWDPEESRLGLGTYSVLKEIELAAERNIPYVYLGYYVEENRHMSYKKRFTPNEGLMQEGKWMPLFDKEGGVCSPELLSHGFLPVLRMEQDKSEDEGEESEDELTE